MDDKPKKDRAGAKHPKIRDGGNAINYVGWICQHFELTIDPEGTLSAWQVDLLADGPRWTHIDTYWRCRAPEEMI